MSPLSEKIGRFRALTSALHLPTSAVAAQRYTRAVDLPDRSNDLAGRSTALAPAFGSALPIDLLCFGNSVNRK